MSGAKELKGYWWLPSTPERQWFGNLTWRPSESPKLKLDYRTADEQTDAPPLQAESILGLEKGGTPVSVFRAGSSGRSRSDFLSDRIYTAGHALKGIHVTSRDGFRAHRFNVSLQYLGAWLREEGFKSPTSEENGFNIQYCPPDDRTFDIAKGITVYLCHLPHSSERSRRREVGYDLCFAMEKTHSFTWKQAFRSIRALKSLLHFACLRRVRPTSITFENLDHTFEVGPNRYPKIIELFDASVAAPETENLHENDFVFTFDQVEMRFGKLCSDWFQFCIEQREALGCYYPTVYFSLPDQLRLISITQALEAYHQRTRRPKDDIKFKDRIKELCSIDAVRVDKVVGNIEHFATAVTNSRDYYTHHHPSIRARGYVATGVKLTMMSYHLQFLFRLSVLAQFGLDADPHSVLLRSLPTRIVEY